MVGVSNNQSLIGLFFSISNSIYFDIGVQYHQKFDKNMNDDWKCKSRTE